MVAVYEFDPKTLIWVKEEVANMLEDARGALEVYLESPEDVSYLNKIAENLHTIRGAVEMLEIFGAVLIAREMEEVTLALVNDEVKLKEDAMDALMRGMLQLPSYLNQLYHGNKDIPLVMLPLLNDMRAVQEKPLLTESEFFAPNMAALKPSLADGDGDGDDITWDIKTIAKNLRPVYLSGLLGVFKEDKLKKSLRMLATVIMNLEQASTQKKTEQLWWISAGVIHALYDGGLELSVSVKLLLGKVDRQIKRLIDEGEAILSSDSPNELIKNLLYYVGRSNSSASRVIELKEAFRLTDSMPDSNAIDRAKEDLIGFNANIMENISKQIKEELLSIKDTVDITVHARQGRASELEPVLQRFNNVAEALGLIGMKKLRKLIHKQEIYIQELIDDDVVLSNEDVIQIAKVLLYVESSLYDLNVKDEANEIMDDKNLGDITSIPEAEYQHVVNTTVAESLEDISKIKFAVEEFSYDASNSGLMKSVPGMLENVNGAVKMLSHPRVVRVIEAIGEYIEHEVLEKNITPEDKSFDLLANAITGIEYYLEGILQKTVTSDSAIEIAELSLANLGYAPQKLAAVKIFEQTPVEEDDEDETGHKLLSLVPAAGSEVDEAEEEMNTQVDDELVAIFLKEAGDELEEISSSLERWKNDLYDPESLAALVRSFHTLKGAGRIVGASSIGVLAWSIEELLRRIEDERIRPSMEIVELLEQTLPMLTQLIVQMKNGEDTESSGSVQSLIKMARELRETKHAVG